MYLKQDVANAKVLRVANHSFYQKKKKKPHAVTHKSGLAASRGGMDLGRKRVRLIRYLVEFDSQHTHPRGLTADSLISEALNPITSFTKPATKALLIAVVLKL